MGKPKYQKPVTADLSAVVPAQGGPSCSVGSPEYGMWDCVNGDLATGTVGCGVGDTVLPGVDCPSGTNAGKSCWTGTIAG